MRRRIDSFLRLSWVERLQFLEAAFSLAAISAGIRAAGYGRTRSMLSRTGISSRAAPLERQMQTVSGLSWSVSAAAHFAPFSTTCLHRTLTLWWLLRRRGIDSQVRIGTAKDADGMHAHAWLEREGVVLNDDADVGARFAAFERFR